MRNTELKISRNYENENFRSHPTFETKIFLIKDDKSCKKNTSIYCNLSNSSHLYRFFHGKANNFYFLEKRGFSFSLHASLPSLHISTIRPIIFIFKHLMLRRNKYIITFEHGWTNIITNLKLTSNEIYCSLQYCIVQ